MFYNQETLADEKQEAEEIAALLGVAISGNASPMFWELPILRAIAERISRRQADGGAGINDLLGELINAGNPYEADKMIVSFLGGLLARVERLEEALRDRDLDAKGDALDRGL